MLLEFLGSLKYEFISDIVPVAVALPECDINISCPRLVPATFDMNDVSRIQMSPTTSTLGPIILFDAGQILPTFSE